MNCFNICSVTVKSAMDGFDVARHLAQHRLGFGADGLDRLLAVGSALVADGDDGRLVEHDALAAHVDQRVGRAEVDGQVGGNVAAQESEHGRAGSAALRSGQKSPLRKRFFARKPPAPRGNGGFQFGAR